MPAPGFGPANPQENARFRHVFACLAIGVALIATGPGCDTNKLLGGASGTGSAAGQGTPGAPAADAGPMVTIAAGSFKAGSPCGATPRITNEELEGVSITLSEFKMDTYPYPNDPQKPAKTGVTQEEAAALCASAGKRLCSELEWERACKGPMSTTFEYGPAYNPNKCTVATDLTPGKRAQCVSAFGVSDMHGLVYEWTSSPFGRGTSGDLASVRGGGKAASVLQARCANAQSRPRTASEKDLGFRCCSGPANSAEVDLALSKQPPMVSEPSVEGRLAEAMLRAMPADHRSVETADVSFDKVFRWHPRDNEEILLARYHGKPKDNSGSYYELAAFKVCGGTPALIARMRGPVETVGNPGAGADPQKASASVATGADKGNLDIVYSYGSVRFDQPGWIKQGNSLVTPNKPKLPVIFPKKK